MTFIFIIIFLLFALYNFMENMDPDGGYGWMFAWLMGTIIDGWSVGPPVRPRLAWLVMGLHLKRLM